MARPAVDDKLKQVPVPIRQSVIDKYGRDEIIRRLKEFVSHNINQ
jgi:hypothetical protein